ncbi:MAG: flagellar hook-length control protein FliK [Rhizobiales bacterium]|nr:flagellar hook-length control protein FliK [Hyphomicrobiales bacterium]MBO6700308.1 flagellar hook-length control protein FliK [Hyphomicrobiales bacterium]MBO6737527.1 flagellar hook-length control protein FliK [Hyphomicrobiales bacterium]MBO6913416.1 flagellar hook-length control protein FliK [Hyphomicrobiales bacterium]MBO6955347.1 flagellar hook-length control protein FliK [Hyphomicrobiales bacterium]
MSTLPDLLAPIAPAERPTPRERSVPREDEPRFSDRLENERRETEEPAERAEATSTDDKDVTETPDSPKKSSSSDSTQATSSEGGHNAGINGAQATEQTAASQDPGLVDDPLIAADTEADPFAGLADPALAAETDDVVQEIVVTALTGETVPLVPPQATGQADPGALGRWFAQVSGPVEGTLGQNAPVLNKLAGQAGMAGEQALSGAPTNGAMDGALEGGLKTATPEGLSQSKTMSFADAMASTSMTNGGMDAESLDALVTQAMAKASAALEPGNSNAPVLTTGQTTATGAQAAMTAVPQAATGQAVPVTALAVEITRQAMNGKTQFDIRLDPPELGRLNVRLEMDASGQTRAHLVVERAETLDMLTTDARNLERALQQAGLKTEPGSVSFELAQDAADGFAQDQHSAGAEDQSGESGSGDPASAGPEDSMLPDDMASPEAIRQQLYATGHLDVRI